MFCHGSLWHSVNPYTRTYPLLRLTLRSAASECRQMALEFSNLSLKLMCRPAAARCD